MKGINDFILEQQFYEGHQINVHGVYEMAQISSPDDNLPEHTSIWVYGEGDEQGTKPPHFHVTVDNKRFEFEIKFDDVNSLDIWRSKTVKHDWKGYSNVKKAIKKWLLEYNKKQPKLTNWEFILSVWNADNDKQVNLDTYMKLLEG